MPPKTKYPEWTVAGTPLITPMLIHIANQEALESGYLRAVPESSLTENLLYARAVAGEGIQFPVPMWRLLPNGYIRVTIRHMRGSFILDMREAMFRALSRAKEQEESDG